MPKTDINKILKAGAATKIKYVDYSTPEAKRELDALKKKADKILQNKFVNWDKLSRIYITI